MKFIIKHLYANTLCIFIGAINLRVSIYEYTDYVCDEAYTKSGKKQDALVV